MKFFTCLVFVFTMGCVESYEPPVVKDAPKYLVVDGFLDATEGRLRVTLSRTIALADNQKAPMERDANVTLEDKSGNTFSIPEVNDGYYERSDLDIAVGEEYRLHIGTKGKEFVSKFEEVKQTPPIETIFWEMDRDGFSIKINTQDPTGNSKYYRWTYSETFEYTSVYSSLHKIQDGEVLSRAPEEYVHQCYKTENVKGILVGTSEGLSSDVIHNFTVRTIPEGALELSRLYSIEVTQYVLSEDAYQYWLNIYKTTENVGGLFAPMPGRVIGNLQCLTNPDETVIGYFGAAATAKERIFIKSSELPENYSRFRHMTCPLDTIPIEEIPTIPQTTLLIYPILVGPDPVGYTTSLTSCIDCRFIGGGVFQKPSFWP